MENKTPNVPMNRRNAGNSGDAISIWSRYPVTMEEFKLTEAGDRLLSDIVCCHRCCNPVDKKYAWVGKNRNLTSHLRHCHIDQAYWSTVMNGLRGLLVYRFRKRPVDLGREADKLPVFKRKNLARATLGDMAVSVFGVDGTCKEYHFGAVSFS